MQTKLDTTTVLRGVEEMKSVVPLCTAGLGASSSIAAAPGYLGRLIADRQSKAARAGVTKKALAFTGTTPADVLGDCGGRMTYPSYTHLNGIITATLRFDNYCNTDSSTGNKQTVNGSISFVNTATPTASGPITTKFEASSAGAITLKSTNAAGAVLAQQSVGFTNFAVSVGVPGGTPTAAAPNRVGLGEVTFTNTANVTRRATDFAASMFETPSGDTQLSVSGRGYRSNGEYFDVSTTVPLVMNANGDVVSGQVTFAGADGTKAVVTLLPGPTLQATVTVNGTPLPGLPSCQ